MGANPNTRSVVRAYLDATGLTQTELASRAGVSQPTVSRAARGLQARRGDQAARLFRFIHEGPVGPEKVEIAFRSIWDGSEAHAEAVARIIEACEGLVPRLD
jgi:transcriptional regulator with XRE-family HTH domain